MKQTRFSLAATATLVLSTSMLFAQSEKPSPYQGVSEPPANDMITPTEQAPATAPVMAAPVVQAPAAAPVQTPAPAPAPAVSNNPDAGIIETPLPPSASEYTPNADAKGLRARSAEANYDGANDNRDGGIVTYVPGPANALPEGTVFKVRMLQDIDAGTVTPGTPFRAQVTQDIERNGKIVVPVGS